MLPAVFPDVSVLLIAIPVLGLPRHHAHAKLVDAHVLHPAILDVQLVYLTIQPVQLFLLVVVIEGLWPIIAKPG